MEATLSSGHYSYGSRIPYPTCTFFPLTHRRNDLISSSGFSVLA